MRAYVVFKVVPQETINVLNALREEQQVSEASVIHGPFDCVAHVQAPTLEAINDFVLRARSWKGVEDTMTCLVVQSWLRQPV